MSGQLPVPRHRGACRTVLGSLLVFGLSACADDRIGPTSTGTEPGTPAEDSVALDGLSAAVLDTRSSAPGIVFGTWNMESSYLSKVHTGWVQGGPLDPSNILSKLQGAKSKGGRVVIKLSKGKDTYVKNSDGTFSLSRWKSLVGAYRNVNFGPYLKDGTIIGHMLIDEPQRASRWGGKVISQATLEEMAKYSKQLWPAMPALVRVVPSWLASAPVSYTHLDAGWLQYASGKGSASNLVQAEAAAAKKKGLGLLVGLNVLDGGDGSSRIAGTRKGKYAMSASELRTYGAALLAQGHVCAFFNWQHNSTYYNRSDVRSAMADLSSKAKAHAKTSCRQ